MAHRRTFGNRFSQGNRRKSGWSVGPGLQSTSLNVTGSSVAIVGSGSVAGSDGITLVRLRGRLSISQTPT